MRAGAFAGRGGDFAGRFGNNFNRFGRNFNRFGNYFGNGLGWRGWGWGWPWYGSGYWPWYSAGYGAYPYGYGDYYPYYIYEDSYPSYYNPNTDYYYNYSPSDYGLDDTYAPSYGGDYSYMPPAYGNAGEVTAPDLTSPQPSTTETSPLAAEEGQQGADEGLQFYSQAREAFLRGDYRGTVRLASHAAVDEPRNPKVHEVLSLALFALGNYGPAAAEAHASMAMGPVADWAELFSYYDDSKNYTAELGKLEREKYTSQLRALEKATATDPKSAADHFLLGYHYLMIGARDKARDQFAQVVQLAANDKLASHYLDELRSKAPLTPPQSPQMASRPQGTSL